MIKQMVCAISVSCVLMNSMGDVWLRAINNVFNQKNEITYVESEWIDDKGMLSFPVTQESEQWDDMNLDERFEVCQMPEELLKSISTEELLYMVEQYPLFTVIYGYDHPIDGLEALKTHFNGFTELLSREDCKDIVLQEYVKWNIPETTKVDYSEYSDAEAMNALIKDKDMMQLVYDDARETYIVRLLEMVLAYIGQYEKFSDDEVATIANAITYKNDMKANSALFEYKECNNYTCIADESDAVVRTLFVHALQEMNEKRIMGEAAVTPGISTMDYVTTKLITTRGWLPVKVTIYTSFVDMTMAEAEGYVANIPEAYVKEVPRTVYNCAAYAWLFLDNKNKEYRKNVWVEDVSPFTSDPRYIRYSSACCVGLVVHWSNGHEGIIEKLDYVYGNVGPQPLVVEKVSGGPLIALPLSSANGLHSTPLGFYK